MYSSLTKIITLSCLTATLLLSGCKEQAESETNTAAISDNAVVLAFGDSLTTGYGVTPEDSYPTVLGNLSNYSIINAGLPGENTTNGLKRFTTMIQEKKPDVAIILQGGIDLYMGVDSATIKNNIGGMITAAKQQGITVVLVGIPGQDVSLNSEPLYEELAAQHNVIFEGNIMGELNKRPEFKSDAVHLNKEGYQKLAEAILGKLQQG